MNTGSSSSTQSGYPFNLEEYEERLRKLRDGMRKADIDILLVTSSVNIFYLSGFFNSGQDKYQCLVVPLDGEPHFILRKLYFTAVEALSWIKDGTPVPDTESSFDATKAYLELIGGGTARIGYDDQNLSLPPAILDGLRAALTGAAFVPAGGLVEVCRKIKSPQEIAYIKQACDLSVSGLEAGIAEIRPGATENDFSAAVYGAMIRGGSDFVSGQPIVMTGPRDPVYRGLTEGRGIKRGDCIWFETSANVRRYGGAIMRTISVGKPSAEIKKVSDVMIGALNAILDSVKPGVTSGEVDRAGRSLVEKAGLGQHWIHRTGYSIGASFPPNWTEGEVIDIKSGDSRVLEPGMTFHTVPWVLYPGMGPIGNSETWTVTEDGVEVLTDTPRELRIVD